MWRKNRKGQSITEYAILFGIVIGALAGMQVYVKRGLNAKFKDGTDAYANITGSFTVTGGQTVTLDKMSQYEPYYVEAKGATYQETVEQQHMGGGQIKNEIVSDIVASAAGGYRAEVAAGAAGSGSQDTRDNFWK
ncbi:MAG: hypothetical protein ABH858_02530 [Candidatus Omnitrophota bacterium]